MKKTTRGFTIVELLIVIVVISILAAIVTVAYSGIQDRAYDAKRANALASYVKLLTMYKNEHGAYPVPANSYACLGERSHYPRNEGWSSEGACYGIVVNGSVHPVVSVDNVFNDLLRQYSSNLPDASYKAFDDQGSRFRGAQYYPGGYGTAQIMYLDKETATGQTCAWGGVVYGSVGSGNRQCTIILK